MKICKVENCGRKYSAKGFCVRHYYYWKRNGVPETKKTIRKWKLRGQGFINMYGYRNLWKNGKKVLEHRWIMQNHLGRELKTSEHIHHINENKLDNRIETLKIVNNSSHKKFHIKDWKNERPCSRCKKNKFLSEFKLRLNNPKSKNRRRFYDSWCKECCKEVHRNWRHEKQKAGLPYS
jgi:hypothetical protein